MSMALGLLEPRKTNGNLDLWVLFFSFLFFFWECLFLQIIQRDLGQECEKKQNIFC